MDHPRRSSGVQGDGATLALAGSVAVGAALAATLFALDNLLPALRVLTVFAGAPL
jgi:hypothetical protein